jgi:hypothetical protein
MRITQILADAENMLEQQRMGAEEISPYSAMQRPDDAQLRQIVARLKKPKPTKIMRQILAEDPSMRPLLQNFSLGYAEEY